MNLVLVDKRHHRKIAQDNWALTNKQMKGMHVHHRIPVSKGGTNDPSNLYVCSPWFHAHVWHNRLFFAEFAGLSFLGKRHTNETKLQMSKSHLGVSNTREHNLNISKAKKGVSAGPCTERRKDLLRSHFTGYDFGTVECPHCGKTGAPAPMIRWHFDNCKHQH